MTILFGVPSKKSEKEFNIVATDGNQYLLDEKSKWAVCTKRDGEIILREAKIFTEPRLLDVHEEMPLVFIAEGQHVKLWTYITMYNGAVRSK